LQIESTAGRTDDNKKTERQAGGSHADRQTGRQPARKPGRQASM
jgi:hypothetical protein